MVKIGSADQPIWGISKTGTYSSLETWNAIQTKLPKANWWRLIWFPITIPGHAFILWLVVRNSLSTGERLLKWGFKGNVYRREVAGIVCFLQKRYSGKRSYVLSM